MNKEETPAATSKEIHEAKLGRRQNAVAGINTANEYPYRHNAVINRNFASSWRKTNHIKRGTPPEKPYIKEDAVTTD